MAATSDTLALAAEERAKQGIHELEISFGGELDLHKHLNDCVKNPGHLKFIPIRKLLKYHIPVYNSKSKFFEWIRQMSSYTVKLYVNYVSPNRPPQLPLSDRAGQRVLSVGSGYVAEIPPSGNDVMPCPFTNCGELPGNHEVFGYFTVVTAAHVVFDDKEAQNTTVEFFDDDPEDRSGVMTARGVKVAAFSVEGDFCELLCVTHDASLVQLLNEPHRCIPDFTVTLSVNCSSHNHDKAFRTGFGRNRPTRSLKRNHLGSEYELPTDSEVHDNITVTTVNAVVNDKEFKNAALEFFYYDPDGTIYDDMMLDYKVERYSCEQLCVTHYPSKFTQRYSLWEIWKFGGKRICDLFQTVLPGIEKIKCTSGTFFEFLVDIRLSNLSEALQTLALLKLLTVEDVHNLLKMSTCGYDSSHDLLKSTSFKIADILHLIKHELYKAELIDRGRQSTSFLLLSQKLTDLCGTLLKPDAENPRNHWHDFLSVISGLVQFYCTVEKFGTIFSVSLKGFSFECSILNRQELVSISNNTATVTVTILRRHERDAAQCYSATSLDRDYGIFESDNTQKCPSELKLTAKECNPNDMLLVHIAHPHGQSKQVTFGRQTDCFTGEGFYHQLYTAPTCPGCSGGPVWMIPASGDLSQIYGVPHSGHIGNELNRGCSWTVYPHQFKL